MSDKHRCHKYGYLVAAAHEVPEDEHEYCASPDHLVGCNRIKCSSCNAYVKQWKGYRISTYPSSREERHELFDTSDPAASRFLGAQPMGYLFRVYACRCQCTEIANPVDLYKGFIEFDSWMCDGHPARP